MSSAIVDAYINDASIYALSYVDPYVQDGLTLLTLQMKSAGSY